MDKITEDFNQLITLTESLAKELEETELKTLQLSSKVKHLESSISGLETECGKFVDITQDNIEDESLRLNSLIQDLDHLQEEVLEVKMMIDTSHCNSLVSHINNVDQQLTDLRQVLMIREERLKTMTVVSDPGDQSFLGSAVPRGWERGLTQDNVPFFMSDESQETQWDHPEYVQMMQELTEMNVIKYSAYRVALKLRKVQQKLCLDLLDISSALVCFQSHGLAADNDTLGIFIPEMVTVLASIFETLHQCEGEEVGVAECVDLTLNWILNIYDPQRQGFIRVLSFKIAIALLCRAPLQEKYSVLFRLAAGNSEVLDQKQLGLLLYDLISVPKYLGEVAQFGGSNIEPSVRSCLSVGATAPRHSVDCSLFVQWVNDDPQSLVWISILHRLACAETATHHVRCRVCRVQPIVGLRYHCKKCFNLDICHNCFFTGATYKGHRSDHPMQEYCTSTYRSHNAKHILQAVKNGFRRKIHHKKSGSKLGYLPVQSLEAGSFDSPLTLPDLSFESNEFITSDSVNSHDPPAAADDDEHSLIASYCKLLTSGGNTHDQAASILHEVDQKVDNMEREAVEQILRHLKEENVRLKREYNQIVEGQTRNCESDEKLNLEQQKERMEARMTILEDHNQQLEAQLIRLRQLVSLNSNDDAVPYRDIVASNLINGKMSIMDDTTEEEHEEKDVRFSATSESLNLSEHNGDIAQDDDFN